MTTLTHPIRATVSHSTIAPNCLLDNNPEVERKISEISIGAVLFTAHVWPIGDTKGNKFCNLHNIDNT